MERFDEEEISLAQAVVKKTIISIPFSCREILFQTLFHAVIFKEFWVQKFSRK